MSEICRSLATLLLLPRRHQEHTKRGISTLFYFSLGIHDFGCDDSSSLLAYAKCVTTTLDMLRPSFETISSHLQIIIHIFNLLAFEDQLRLSRVSNYLKSVFECYIWQEKYDSLKVFETAPAIVITNYDDVNQLYLNSRVFQEFLHCYAAGVNKLTIRSTVLEDDELQGLPEVAPGRLIVEHHVNMRLFPNVTSLQYYYMKVPSDHLKLIANLYPNLQELRLINCFFDDQIQYLLEDIISQMENLKTLVIYTLEQFRIKHKQLSEVVKNLKLECLKLTAVVDPDESIGDASHSSANILRLKELYLAAPCNSKSWSNRTYPIFINTFEILSILTIQITDKVTDEVLRTFAQICQHLEVFNIRFADFEDVEMFSLPPKLTDLSLYRCEGLSYNNLKQILAESKITKFYSKDTGYKGERQDIDISARITSLHVPFRFGCNLNYAKSGDNLKELTLYQPVYHNDDMTASMLETCTNLQVLETKDFHVPLDIVLKMQSLHEFIMPHPVPSVNWSYIVSVLQHQPLEQLIIRGYCRAGGYQKLLSNVPSLGFKTFVKNLEIPLDIAEVAIDFWLDLFNKNINLNRICCTFSTYTNHIGFLECLVKHTNFPRTVQSINVCGFVLDCNDLRRNFNFRMNELNNPMDFTQYWYGGDTHRIILQKRKNIHKYF